MTKCSEVLVDAYDGRPLLKCDSHEGHRGLHLDKVQDAEWRQRRKAGSLAKVIPSRPPKSAKALAGSVS